MSTLSLGLGFATIALKVFSEERQRYYRGKVEGLLKEIDEVNDSEFAKKDMNKKGQAERALLRKKQALEFEMTQEASKL